MDIKFFSEIQRIINQTDVDTARKFFIKTVLPRVSEINGPLNTKTEITALEYISRVGINRFFANDIMRGWGRSNLNEMEDYGWDAWLDKHLVDNQRYINFANKFTKTYKL